VYEGPKSHTLNDAADQDLSGFCTIDLGLDAHGLSGFEGAGERVTRVS
jgi:hypothetical protein